MNGSTSASPGYPNRGASALRRLSLAYAATFLLISAMVFAGAMHLVTQKNQERLQSLVFADSRELADKLNDAPPALRAEVARAIVGTRIAQGKDRVQYALVARGQHLFGNLDPQDIKSTSARTLRLRTHGWLSSGAVDRVEAGPGAYVLIARSQDDAGLERDMAAVGLLALALGAVVAFVIAPLAGRHLVRRVEAINRACEAFGAGDMAVRAPGSQSRDEFGTLARSVNGMFERIDDLVGGLRDVSNRAAHDLRTPIARLRSLLEQGRAAPTLAAAREAAQAAVAETDRILATFDALLDIAEIEAGSTLAFVEIDLEVIVAEAVKLYEPVAEEAGIDLSIRTQSAITRGETSLLVRLVANLLDNAIKYAPRGSAITVILTTTGDQIHLRIEDQGPGISVDQRTAVLRRTVRGPQETKGGLGLGLALVAAVARRHGANLALGSRDFGQGLRVDLSFSVNEGRNSPGFAQQSPCGPVATAHPA